MKSHHIFMCEKCGEFRNIEDYEKTEAVFCKNCLGEMISLTEISPSYKEILEFKTGRVSQTPKPEIKEVSMTSPLKKGKCNSCDEE